MYSVPAKVWEALSAGKPVIVAKGTHVGEFISQAHAGIAVEPAIDEISLAIESIRDNYDYYASGARALGSEYTWESVEAGLLEFYRCLEDGRQ
jgi:glycosyltransferase involved in cell wall biosynthesis